MARHRIASISRHLDGLSPAARDSVAWLNENPQIGPFAPGDGDLIMWHAAMLAIFTGELLQRHPSLSLAKVPDFSWTVPTQGPQESDAEHLIRDLRTFGISVISGIFPSMTPDQFDDWSRLYDSILLPELHAQWGGRPIRIGKRRKSPSDRAAMILEGMRQGLQHEKAFGYAGVSRATGYRLLAQIKASKQRR
jgi:hypothetical protein